MPPMMALKARYSIALGRFHYDWKIIAIPKSSAWPYAVPYKIVTNHALQWVRAVVTGLGLHSRH